MTGGVGADAVILDPGPEVTLRCNFGERTLQWGNRWQWASASYWADQASRHDVPTGQFRFGTDLTEEIAACILGGFGMPAGLGLAAFAALRDAKLLSPAGDAAAIEEVLRRPLRVGDRAMRYRFPHQRAVRLAAALAYIDAHPVPLDARKARDALTRVPGVGPKTASWVVRNHFDSDEVAIVDVHLCRAGVAAGVFDRTWDIAKDYLRFEGFFLAWARHAAVRPSVLDGCIWAELARVGSTTLPTRHA